MPESLPDSSQHQDHYGTDLEGFAHAIATILSRGYILSGKDIELISSHYDYVPTNTTKLMQRRTVRGILMDAGVNVYVENYRYSNLYYDGETAQNEDSMAQAKADVDKRFQAGREKFKRTVASTTRY
jgi:hypothetical protein